MRHPVQARTTWLMMPQADVGGVPRARSPPALALAVAGWALASALVPAMRRYDAYLRRRVR